MADELTLKLKVMKTLYGLGLKGMGDSLIGELRKGGPEWMNFAGEIINGIDYPRRKLILKQLVSRGFIEKNKNRDQLTFMLLEFLTHKDAIGDEKKVALNFVSQNLPLFPAEDDAFRGKILALQRDRDSSLAAIATDLLPKIGVNMDDRDLYRQG